MTLQLKDNMARMKAMRLAKPEVSLLKCFPSILLIVVPGGALPCFILFLVYQFAARRSSCPPARAYRRRLPRVSATY
jgi:hypothetical protein